ncbi:uncharacterized protein BT62DRAFT_1009837 [Guyanagaster necrorhizus]|uniref:Uncharacterized protein n=1 Tax=Guyanagaster necrorhizus TaxID=856835 RepID=A0A9P8AQG2_9AGAR|nr:uncharacterized protein BT62DRAFT_1009837 [Guyanagaster necrorhizus MCA 3950]KAG7442837.1 hypothetical protein BT62DRAFT_1009837 [Guyanagaster necrorhizus MCA 3950]
MTTQATCPSNPDFCGKIKGTCTPPKLNFFHRSLRPAFTTVLAPQSRSTGFGTEPKVQLFFGFNQVNTSLDSFTFILISGQEITDMNTCLLQSAFKVFVSGNLGSVSVPGRTAAETAIFTSSLPVIVTSTTLFRVLSVFTIMSYCREGTEAYFTLYPVAAALDGSFAKPRMNGYGNLRGSFVEDQMRCEESRDDRKTGWSWSSSS